MIEFGGIVFKTDLSGKSPAFFISNIKDELTNLALTDFIAHSINSGFSTSRLCLHETDSTFQSMIIFQRGKTESTIHKHSDVSETYTVLRGEMIINLFDDNLQCIDSITLNSSNDSYTTKRNLVHQTIAQSDYLIFKEFKDGVYREEYTTIYESAFIK